MSGAITTADRAAAGALDVLFDRSTERPGRSRGGAMPEILHGRYGGPMRVPLRQDRPTVVANLVETVDGIAALGSGDLAGGGPISGFNEPDRFVMALLRALADVVVVGAGTLRGSSRHRWTPDHVAPDLAADLARWRSDLGLAPQPTTVVVTGTGEIPVGHGGLTDSTVPVVVATTPLGADRLRGAGLAAHVAVEAVGDGRALAASDVVALAKRLGARVVLTEGGPHLFGQFLASDLVDELFLTVAPQVVGRSDGRLGLVEGVALAPAATRWFELVSVRRSANHLFLRYDHQTQQQEQ